MSSLAALALLAVAVSGAFGLDTAASVASSLTFDATGAKNRPVSKVITLLKDMLKQLEKEADDDEAVYNKLACWCAENDKEKTAAIKAAEARIAALQTRSDSLQATSSRLNTEIGGLTREKVRDVTSLDESTSIRTRQQSDFHAEERDLLESIGALKAAIVIISKHHSSLLQMPRSRMMSVAATVERELQKHDHMLKGVLSPSQKKKLVSFIQQEGPTFKQNYAPNSGEVLGILKQMLETFQSGLSQAQKEELRDHGTFTELADAKNVEITTESDQADTKSGQRANTDEKKAQAVEDIGDTTRSLRADEDFLLMLKEKCQMTDKEWDERQRTRQREMRSVSKALALLSDDDAHDLFTRTFNPSLVQRASSSQSRLRERASRLLDDAARRLNRPQLSTLAFRIRLDAFTKVKEAIDQMVAQLAQEKKDEIKHKDFCNDEFSKNQLQTEKKVRDKEDTGAEISDKKLTIKQYTDAIADLQSQVKEMQVQMKRAGEDREKENREFQDTISDQRATQKLLTSALGVLQDFYGQHGTTFVQEEQPQSPSGFESYKKSAANPSVIGLLKQIISDAKGMEAEAVRSEEFSQKSYEDFVKDTNLSIQAKSEDIVSKSQVKADAEAELVTQTKSLESTKLELSQLSNYNAELHTSCDYVLKNFDVRQTARDEEVEALKQAKAILSGSKFASFLQSH